MVIKQDKQLAGRLSGYIPNSLDKPCTLTNRLFLANATYRLLQGVACLSLPFTILVRCESLEHHARLFQPARRVYPLSIPLGPKAADNLHDHNVFYDTLN